MRVLCYDGLYSFLIRAENQDFGLKRTAFVVWCSVGTCGFAIWLLLVAGGCCLLFVWRLVLVWVTVVRFFVYTPSINRVN